MFNIQMHRSTGEYTMAIDNIASSHSLLSATKSSVSIGTQKGIYFKKIRIVSASSINRSLVKLTT